MPSPLDRFATKTPEAENFDVPDLPKLSDHIKEHGLKAGAPKFDEAMQNWLRKFKLNLNAKVRGKTGVSSGKD